MEEESKARPTPVVNDTLTFDEYRLLVSDQKADKDNDKLNSRREARRQITGEEKPEEILYTIEIMNNPTTDKNDGIIYASRPNEQGLPDQAQTQVVRILSQEQIQHYLTDIKPNRIQLHPDGEE
jgi:hypothetical protein